MRNPKQQIDATSHLSSRWIDHEGKIVVVENRKEGEVGKRKRKTTPQRRRETEQDEEEDEEEEEEEEDDADAVVYLPISSSMFAFLFPNYRSRENLKTDCKTLYTNFKLICREFRLH
jgi:uncharacterized protein YcbK (DUF882 family)